MPRFSGGGMLSDTTASRQSAGSDGGCRDNASRYGPPLLDATGVLALQGGPGAFGAANAR